MTKKKKKACPEVSAVTLQYSQHCCFPQIAFPRWLTPEQMLLVKVLAAMHQVQTLFFFHLNWFVSSQIAYPRKLISRLGEINHGVTLFQTRELFVNLLSVMPAKTPAVIAKPLDVLVLELFFIVGLFLCVSLAVILSALSLSPSLHCYTSVSKYKPWSVLMYGVPVPYLRMLTNTLAPQRWLPSRD